MGDICLADKDLKGARRHFGNLLALEPGSVQANYKNGVLKLIENKSHEAASLFEKALEIDPDFVPALRRLIDMLVKDEALDKAFARCKEQMEMRPKNAEYHVLLGTLYGIDKDYEKARKSFEEALEIEPTSSNALFNLARLEQLQGSIDAAIAKYEKVRKQTPNNLGVTMLIATLLEKKGEFSKAKRLYEEVLEKNPKSSAAANNLAFFYAEHEPTKENLARAERLVGPLLEKHKDNPDIVDTAAWIYYRKEDFERARDLLAGVSDMTGKRSIISYHLGMVYLALGNEVEGRKHLEEAMKGEEQFPGRSEAEKKLLMM
ncbi:MAG: tetratricopeptide repeat protein [Deltaproteobacteria bacterium]|nr:tetratricopeptide repeat protein [Deltaproteobacteria bacterium]